MKDYPIEQHDPVLNASILLILAFSFVNSLKQSFFSKKRLLDFLFCIMGIRSTGVDSCVRVEDQELL